MRTLVPAMALLALASSCTLNTDYFSEYRGVNLLSNYDFDALDGTTPKWSTTTYGKLTAGVDNYMLWEPAADLSGIGDGTATTLDVGPDGTSPAYRLEIKNLVPDGDFEAEGEIALSTAIPASLGTIGWSDKSGAPKYRFSSIHDDNGQVTTVQFDPGVRPITLNHRSMLFSAQTAGNQASLSLKTALGAALWLQGSYRIRLDFINAATDVSMGFWLAGTNLDISNAENGGAWVQTDLTKVSVLEPGRYSISKSFIVSSAAEDRELLIGANNPAASDAALIDNVRVIPAEIDLSATAKFSSLKSGALQLLPGTKSGAYTFTVFVHDDPTSDQTGLSGNPGPIAHQPNRFYPNGLTITVLGRSKNKADAVLAHEFIVRPVAGWTNWTQITLNGGLDFVDTDDDLEGAPALQISFSPTNAFDLSTGGKDVGSLLLSQPTLTFNP